MLTSGLRVEGLTVRFGGLTAVNGITLDAPLGRITALIGPNGAGKTTTFNACTGLNSPSEGRVFLDGHDVGHLPPQSRARRGLGRTFQRMELFDSLTVRENVALGREGRFADQRPWNHLLSRRADRALVRKCTVEALELCGIGTLAERQPIDLSTGQRRLVELARVIAGGFTMLLLDEPSSGLDKQETAQFARVLRQLVTERGVGILVVEHDMSLVLGACDYIYVLDFGKPIFEGTPAEVSSSDLVRAAYLGSDAVDPDALTVV
jgi:ABC-type branched-subunit amino acid transport system ATPase component